MNAQEIFDTVAKHLATQGCQSLSATGDCSYRGERGLKCAVGILISDEEYTPFMEGNGPGHEALPNWFGQFESLLRDLQSVHDDSTTGAALCGALKRAAAKRGLSHAILDTLSFPEVWS